MSKRLEPGLCDQGKASAAGPRGRSKQGEGWGCLSTWAEGTGQEDLPGGLSRTAGPKHTEFSLGLEPCGEVFKVWDTCVENVRLQIPCEACSGFQVGPYSGPSK